jgi:hypothetical protein
MENDCFSEDLEVRDESITSLALFLTYWMAIELMDYLT